MYIYEPGKESIKHDAEMKSALIIIELDTELGDLYQQLIPFNIFDRCKKK